MKLQLLIEEVDFSPCVVTKGSRPLRPGERDWSCTQKCNDEDSFEVSLDFGHQSFGIPPEIFKQAEVIFQEAGDALEVPQYGQNHWFIREANKSGAVSGDINIASQPLHVERPRRIFSGAVVEIEQEDVGGRPYPLYRLYCKGWGWRMNNITLFGPPNTSLYHRQSDVQIILHTQTSEAWEEYKQLVLQGNTNYGQYGFAPALVDWFQHREIIRPGNRVAWKDTSPGNLIELGAHTKSGLISGWNVIGSPNAVNNEDGQPEYLTGSEILQVFPVGETPGKILNGLASWSGSVWWISPYKEINYTRPQDWPAKVLGTQFNMRRTVNVENLATAIIMMNANVQAVNETWILEPLVAGNTEHILADRAQPLFTNIIDDGQLHVERVQLVEGTNAVTGLPEIKQLISPVNFIFGFPPADSVQVVTNADGSTSNILRYIPPSPPYPARAVPPPADMYYDNTFNVLRVRSDEHFRENEIIRFAPFTLLIPQTNWNVLELFYDPTLGDSAGMYIKPVYMDNAHTIWDSLRRVAEYLEKGSDLDVLRFYSFTGAYGNENDEWYDLRGKAIEFESEFLQIDSKQPFSRRRATYAEMKRLQQDIGKAEEPAQIIEFSILDAEYDLEVVEWRRVTGPEGIVDASSYTGVWGDHSFTISPLADTNPVRLSGEMEIRRFRHIIEAVWAYLAELGTQWISNSDIDAGLFYLMRSEDLAYRQRRGLSQQTTVQETVNEIMQIYFSLHLENTFHSRFFLSQLTDSADVRGYYCREMRITPIGPETLRYEVTAWRDPPQPQGAMRDGAMWMARGSIEGRARLYKSALPLAVPQSVPYPG